MAPPSALRRAYDNVVLRAAAYYALLFFVGPYVLGLLPRVPLTGGEGLSGVLRDPLTTPTAPEVAGPVVEAGVATTIVVAMLGAVVVSLPVAWVFILTRQKRGYQQSVVQLLIALPPIVAGVVVLVKVSLALAFSLAGIVAAVRFRSTLDDSKDAVYAFLAISVGVTAGVDLYAAYVLSLVFSAVAVAMWYTDFGRAPAHLEGRVAQRKLDRAMQAVSRTGTFVARLDKELFEHMSPEQLEAAADRAWRRGRRSTRETEREGSGDRLLRVHTADPESVRDQLEPVLDERAKRWSYGGVVREDDGARVVEYTVALRKRDSAEDFVADLRAAVPAVSRAELK